MDFSAYRSKCTIIDLSNPTQTYFFEPKTAISLHLSSSTIGSREFAFSRNLNQFYVNELNFLVENNIEHLKNKKENKTFFLKHSRGIGVCRPREWQPSGLSLRTPNPLSTIHCPFLHFDFFLNLVEHLKQEWHPWKKTDGLILSVYFCNEFFNSLRSDFHFHHYFCYYFHWIGMLSRFNFALTIHRMMKPEQNQCNRN